MKLWGRHSCNPVVSAVSAHGLTSVVTKTFASKVITINNHFSNRFFSHIISKITPRGLRPYHCSLEGHQWIKTRRHGKGSFFHQGFICYIMGQDLQKENPWCIMNSKIYTHCLRLVVFCCGWVLTYFNTLGQRQNGGSFQTTLSKVFL